MSNSIACEKPSSGDWIVWKDTLRIRNALCSWDLEIEDRNNWYGSFGVLPHSISDEEEAGINVGSIVVIRFTNKEQVYAGTCEINDKVTYLGSSGYVEKIYRWFFGRDMLSVLSKKDGKQISIGNVSSGPEIPQTFLPTFSTPFDRFKNIEIEGVDDGTIFLYR